MKKRGISLLLSLVFLLSVFMFCATAFAAENAADGLTAVLETDKDAYAQGENIQVTLNVSNTADNVSNIRTELIVPEGVTLVEGALKSEAVQIPAGEKVNFAYVLAVPQQTPTTQAPTTQAPTTGEDNGNTPETGDFRAVVFGALALLSLGGLAAITFGGKLMKQRWFVLILCVGLLFGLLAPITASAYVEADKTFEVTKAITIDGNAADVKAVITYDVEAYEEEVAFIQNGASLWNVKVDRSYLSPYGSTIDGVKTEYRNRIELDAPYISMLLGSGSAKGEFTKDIFNKDAEQYVHLGMTGDAAVAKALSMIGKDEWIIVRIDGKLVVTGWFDNATVAAARELYRLATAGGDVTLSLPITGKMDGYATNIPDLKAGNFWGGVDGDRNVLTFRYTDVTEADFKAYTAELEAAGFELYQENQILSYEKEYNRFKTYIKGDDSVTVMYLTAELLDGENAVSKLADTVPLKQTYNQCWRESNKEIRIVTEKKANLFPNETAEDWNDLGITPKIHTVNLYDQYGDGNNIGLSMIYTLADGSFLIWDGGYDLDYEQLYRTLVEKNERPDGKIVIAGWFLTHDHWDHTGAIQKISTTEYAKNITIENVIFNPLGETYSWRVENDPFPPTYWRYGWAGNMANMENIISKYNDAEKTRFVNPHVGQKMVIRNAEIEVLFSGADEDLLPVVLNNNNSNSLVTKVTIGGQTVLQTGDAGTESGFDVILPLFFGSVDSDIVQISHHGLGGMSSKFYNIFEDTSVAVWPTNWATINKNNLMTAGGAKAMTNLVDLNIVAEEYVHTMELPFDAKKDVVVRTKIGTFKTGKYDAVSMKLAVLPTFRFGGKITERLDATVEYILQDDPDVLALTVFDWMANAYNGKGVDTIAMMAEAMGYPYWHYSPAWVCDADGDFQTGEGTIGQLILSRYPIHDAEVIVVNEGTTADSKNEGRSVGHVVLDVEGLSVDVYATHFGSTANWDAFTEKFEPKGDFWFILGNTKVSDANVLAGYTGGSVKQAVSGNLNIIASGKTNLKDSKSENITSICPNFDPYVRTTAELNRALVGEEVEPGQFDEIPTVMEWWCNYRNLANMKKCVVGHLNLTKAELVAMVHVPGDAVGSPEAAAAFAAECGYEHFAYVVVDADLGAEAPFGHILLSYYPLEVKDPVVLRADNAEEGKEGRAFGYAIATINGKKVHVFFGENDGGGGDTEAHKKTLSDKIKELVPADESFIVAGATFGSPAEYGGRAVKCFSSWNSIIVSADLPMSNLVEGNKNEIGTTIPNIDPPLSVDLVAENVVPEVPVDGLKVLDWWCNYRNDAGNRAKVVDYLKNAGYDIVSLQLLPTDAISSDEAAAQFATDCGYNYYNYVVSDAVKGTGHMLLSKYPLEQLETVVLEPQPGKEGRAFGHSVVTLGDKKVDIYYGVTDNSDDMLRAVTKAVKDVYDSSKRDFVVTGYKFNNYSGNFQGLEIDPFIGEYGSIIVSSGITMSGEKVEKVASYGIPYGAIDNLDSAVLKVNG